MEDPSIFAIALETLAVRAFGDMGQTARLRLIRDRFIAGQKRCELRRHLDSVPPENPIWCIVDRCRVWVSHADSEVRRVSKPGPDPAFPTYVVSDPDRGVDDLRVAAVTTPQSTPDQVEKFVRRLLTSVAAPAPNPAPEPPVVERGLPPVSVVMFDPRTPGVQHGSPSSGKELLHGQGLRPCRPGRCHSRYLQGFL